MTANGSAGAGNASAPPLADPGLDLVTAALPFVAFAIVAGAFVAARVIEARRRR